MYTEYLSVAFAFMLVAFHQSKSTYGVLIIVIVFSCISIIQKKVGNTLKMHLINFDENNEVVVLEAQISKMKTLFMVDTGYAGPPVLSSNFIGMKVDQSLSVTDQYKNAINTMKNNTQNVQNKLIDTFIQQRHCYTYTSGCTMRLMSIGTTQEQQADMLMCPMLELKNTSFTYVSPKHETNVKADVFVTNPIKNCIHILTCDFLLHSSPCQLSFKKQELNLNIPLTEYTLKRTFFKIYPFKLSGGAFVVDINVGGEIFSCTVDTGAPGPVCLGSNAINRLNCLKKVGSLQQIGINGEKLCSQVIETSVSFANQNWNKMLVFVNDSKVDNVDGYIGLGLLRAFDILISYEGIGFKKSGLETRNAYSISEESCENISMTCNMSSTR